MGWTAWRAEPASHLAAAVGPQIGQELASEWQVLLAPPTAHLIPQMEVGAGALLGNGARALCRMDPIGTLEGVPEIGF